MTDVRRISPSTSRNRAPILAVLERVLPAKGKVLEIASGTGEHAVFLARALPGIAWQPSDPDAAARASIEAWRKQQGLANVAPPLDIDVRASDWGAAGPFDALVAINMIHYSPWDSTRALFAGAARLLAKGGIAFLYGPFKRDGRHTAPSNEAFERWLKERDPAFGVRDLGEVAAEAGRAGLALREVVEMPANNLCPIFGA